MRLVVSQSGVYLIVPEIPYEHLNVDESIS